jgi:Protein of unknown function (DUF2637)
VWATPPGAKVSKKHDTATTPFDRAIDHPTMTVDRIVALTRTYGLLIGATAARLTGNIAHAVVSYIPPIVVQIGAAAFPIALLAAVHGIALAVRAGASLRVYCWAVTAVAAIGVGAFAVSFLALQDLMQAIGYSSGSAWVFPAIIDTAVAVSTLMLVALGNKPARRTRMRPRPPVHKLQRCSD